MPKFSEKKKEQLARLFDQGISPKEASEKTRVSPKLVKIVREKWLLQKRRFNSYSEYHDFIARNLGYDNFVQYQGQWLKDRGFDTPSAYRKYLFKNRLLRRLRYTPIAKRYGEDVTQSIADECVVIKNKVKLMDTRISNFLAAATCRVLRKRGEVAAFKDISKTFHVSKWKVIDIYKKAYGEETKPRDTESVIKKFVADFKLPDYMGKRMLKFYRENFRLLVKSKHNAKAAVCVYSVAYGKLSKKDVYSNLGVTLPTLNGLLKLLDKN